jgi:adenylate cyclase
VGLGWALAAVTLVAVLAAVAWAGLGKFGAREAGQADAAGSQKGPTIAVLAFDNLSDDPTMNAFADGLSEQLIADLSANGVYDVLARNTTFVYKGKAVDVPEIGRKLGAQYVIEGSVRRVADKLAVTAQLIDAPTGAHVWAQTLEEAAASTSAGDIQDKVARRISAAVADMEAGVIAQKEFQRSRNKSAEALSPFECVAAQGQTNSGIETGDIARARACLELTVKRNPSYAPAWSSLSQNLIIQRWYGSDLSPAEAQDIDKRAYLLAPALEAARRAVELAPDKAFAHFALAKAYYAACQPDRLRVEADRVIALDPSNVLALGAMGDWLAFSGDWDYGKRLAEKAIALAGPSAPTWWGWATAKSFYHAADYANAYQAFLLSYADGSWLDLLHVIYTLPYLGRTEEAKTRIPELVKLRPDISVHVADQFYKMWCFDEDYRAKMTKALRMAGLREEASQPGATKIEAAAQSATP